MTGSVSAGSVVETDAGTLDVEGPWWLSLIKQSSATRLDIFLLGITAILSGQVTAWNDATNYGYWIVLSSAIFPSLGYVILTFCVAETTSALPFSGGVYGVVRAFTTPLLGFVVAVFEIMLNVSYVSPVVYLLGALPSTYGPMSESLILVNCLVIYLIILAILLVGGRVFWTLNAVLGCIVLALFLIYIFGSCSYANFNEWGRGEYYDYYETHEFMQQIPMISTCYLGLQLVPLTSRCASKPKKDVPIVMCVLVFVAFFITFALFTLASSQYPGIDGLAAEDFPLNYGFRKILNISHKSAVWLNAPCLFATAFGFIFFCGRQLSCMAGSRLLPEIFARVIPSLDTPYVSLITFTFISFVLNIATFYNREFIQTLYLVSSLSSFIVYILALIGYIRFHKKYSSLERFFASPLGIPGAYVGIFIFAFCFIGGAIFQETTVPIIVISVVAVLAVVYFIFFAGEHVFSEEEREELFKAYLVNGKYICTFISVLVDDFSFFWSLKLANLATKKRMQKRGQVTPLTHFSRSKHSDVSQSAPFSGDVNSTAREEKNQSSVGPIARSVHEVMESGSNKENHLSSPVPVTSSSKASK